MNTSTTTPTDDGAWFKALQRDVQPTTFKKGREYAQSRRVSALARVGGAITARVTGNEGQKYDVKIQPENGNFTSQCNCESWNKYGPHCKHVVAVALVYLARLRAAGQKPDVPPVESASLDNPPPNGAAANSDENESENGSAGGDSAGDASEEVNGTDTSVESLPVARPDDVVPLPALAKLENWLGLSALPDLEFLYRLSAVPQGAGARHWVIDVRRLDQQGKGPIHVKRTLSSGARITPADERVFLQLARHEARYDGRIVLSDEDLSDVLELLRARRVLYRGTGLVFSAEPARPTVRLENRDDGAVARLDLTMPDGTSVGLKDAVVLSGVRTWVMIGQTTYTLEPDFPPRLLRKWLLEPNMTFPTGQIDRVLTYFAAHLPRFHLALKADGLDVDEDVAPHFVLTVEGVPEKVRARLAAKYGAQVTVPVSPSAVHLGYASGGGTTGRKLYLRRELEERAAGKALTEQGFKYDPAGESYEASGDAALEFWSKGKSTLPDTWDLFAAAAPKIRMRPKVKPRIRVNMSAVNWFELDADFITDDQSVDLGAIRMWLDSGRRFIALKDGTFAEADLGELKAAADLLEEAGAMPGKKRTKLPLFHAPALDALAGLSDVEIDAKARKAMQELKEIDGIPAVRPPATFTGTLRNYQEAGLSWLWFLYRHGLSGVLADDMGLGKTVQALTLLLKVKGEEGPKVSMVVAPTSVLANWEREVQRFAPSLSTVVWHGQDRHEKAESLSGVDVVLTSYSLIRRDMHELKDVKWRLVILDEAQNIKNADSATAQACKSIEADTRLALTGTPLENRLTELWSEFDFLMPGFLGTADGFHDRFEHPIMVQGDMEVRDRLKRRIHPFVLRRLKTEVAKDLPPKTETVAFCEMEPGQAALYREVLEESRKKVYDTIDKMGYNRSRVSIHAALMKLRQVCCDPRLLTHPPGTSLPPSAKLVRFNELVDDLVAEGHRALVFSQFTEMLEILKGTADSKKLGYMYLDGRTKDRMAKVDAFNAVDGPPLFFISLKAGGTGLNLTAADYVIHYDPWWNPAVEDQATDRTHRIGQTRAVFSYKLITKGTVEEKILALQQRKRELAAGVLGTDSEVGKALSEHDVEELFRND